MGVQRQKNQDSSYRSELLQNGWKPVVHLNVLVFLEEHVTVSIPRHFLGPN